MMTMMTTTTTLVNRVMTSVLVPVIMYAPLSIVLPLVTPFSIPGSISSSSSVLCMWRCCSLTGMCTCIPSVSTLIMYTSYSGTSFVLARHHRRPMVMISTSVALRRRCGCVSSVRGSACFFIYGVYLLRSLCPTGEFVAWILVVTCANLGRRFSDI